MISLFTRATAPLKVVTLPIRCVSAEESNGLAAKREAQLQWMRDKGMTYLGDPLKQPHQRPQPQSAPATVRLVSVREDGAATPPQVAAAAGETATRVTK